MDEPDQAYVDGHRAGYVKGRDDGIGFADAKLRAYSALDALEDAETVGKPAVSVVRDALAMTIGKRS